MLKSKKTIFGTILCALIALCLLVCTLSFNKTNTVLVFGDSISTLNDVLATVTDFPTTEEDAWVSENGAIIYIKDEKLNFVSDDKSTTLALNMDVSLSGDDYTYFSLAPWHANFNMKDGKLVSITVDVMNEAWECIAGKYLTAYNLWIGGVRVNDDNKNNVLGDGKISFNPSTSTLTLNSATIDKQDTSKVDTATIEAYEENFINVALCGIATKLENLNIVVKGTSKIGNTFYNFDYAILSEFGNVTISGSKLSLYASEYCAYIKKANLLIDKVNLYFEANGMGIDVTAEEENGYGYITINNSTITGIANDGFVIISEKDTTVNNSTLDLTLSNDDDGSALCCSLITVNGNKSNLDIKCPDGSRGIASGDGSSLIVNGGIIKIKSEFCLQLMSEENNCCIIGSTDKPYIIENAQLIDLEELPLDQEISLVTGEVGIYVEGDEFYFLFATVKDTSLNGGYLIIRPAPLQKKGLSAIAIVFICLGGLLLLLLIAYVLGYFFLYRKGKLDDKKIRIIYKFLPKEND